MTNEQHPTPRIYIADVVAAAQGIERGLWIDADKPLSEIYAAIGEMLGNSPVPGAVEFAIEDYEGFGDLLIASFEDIKNVAEWGALIKQHGPLFFELTRYLREQGRAGEVVAMLKTSYQGAFDSLSDWAKELASRDIPEPYHAYVDWDAIGMDAETVPGILGIELDGKVHVFAN